MRFTSTGLIFRNSTDPLSLLIGAYRKSRSIGAPLNSSKKTSGSKLHFRSCGKKEQYVSPERFHSVFTSKQLKVKPKSNNISGLQIPDIIAHPSRDEILSENDLLDRPLAHFAKKIIDILQDKYYRHQERIFGKKFL